MCEWRWHTTSFRMNCLFYISVLPLAITTMAEDSNLDQLIHNGSNKITAKMFYEVTKVNPDTTVVLSGFSVMPPLAQLALASIGESHDELLEGIGMPNDDVTKAVFSYVNTQIRSTKGVTLKTASKIYVAEKYELNPDFAAVTRDSFGSEVQKINFIKNQDAANQINAWVEDQTNHRIKDLVDPKSLNENSRALLVNAIYFKGTWKKTFSKDSTTNKKFHVSKSKDTEVPMMFQTGRYKYAHKRELNAQILEIPYKGDESSFLIVLPHDIDGIKELKEKFRNPTVLDEVQKNLTFTEVDVTIPKFKIETKIDLKDILKKINIKKMFDPTTAKLYNLLENTADLYIDSAIQKAFMEINEEGAEAAAANQFGITYFSAYVPPPPIPFVADHPFLFFLYHGNNIIFNGIYYG